MKKLKLQLPNGLQMRIPAGAIQTFETMREGKNPHFPDARTYVQFDGRMLHGLSSIPGSPLEGAILVTEVSEFASKIFKQRPKNHWHFLTLPDGDRVYLLKTSVTSLVEVRMAVSEEDPTEKKFTSVRLSLSRQDGPISYLVTETADQIDEEDEENELDIIPGVPQNG